MPTHQLKTSVSFAPFGYDDMDTTFTSDFGTFSLNAQRDKYIAKDFERLGHPHKGDIELLMEYITPESIIVDVGAHIGTMTVPFARKAKVVHSFEPMPENLALLRYNLEQNGVRNVEVHPNALGSREGLVSLTTDNEGSAASYKVSGAGTTEMRTLDSFGLSPDLIKIDAEGYEPHVLEGAKETIRRCRPVVFFELFMPFLRAHPHALARIEDVLEGYSFWHEGRKYPRLFLIPLLNEPKSYLLRNGGLVRNVLALPWRSDSRHQAHW